MSKSVDDIIAKFPNKTLPSNDGEPDYAFINSMMQTLYGNAATLATPLGGGHHGHVGLIMKDALYATLSPTQYIAPDDPGPVPLIAQNATAPVRQHRKDAHNEARRIYENHGNMDDALKAMVIDAVGDTYICELRNKYTGYLGVTTRDLLDHLMDRYGKITAADLEDCKKMMNEPIDGTQPIDMYFKRVDDAVQYAADARTPFTPEQIQQTAYHAISSSGLYTEACKEWRKKPVATKTWVNFKTFFATEYHDLREQQRINAVQSGFHSANQAVEQVNIMQALDNLAMAATSDRDIVAQLTTSNAALSAANKSLTEQLQVQTSTFAALLTQASQSRNGTDGNRDYEAERRKKYEAKLDPNGYCWTHGYRVVKGHTSANCSAKSFGHKDAATRHNIMAGNENNKGWKPKT